MSPERSAEKEKGVKETYPGFFGRDRATRFLWNDFWAHRNAIMHGDQDARADENTATVALLFPGLTMYSAFSLVEEDEAEEG